MGAASILVVFPCGNGGSPAQQVEAVTLLHDRLHARERAAALRRILQCFHCSGIVTGTTAKVVQAMGHSRSRASGALSADIFGAAFDALGIGIVVLDHTERVVFFNNAMGRVSGYDDGLSISSLGIRLQDPAEDQKLKDVIQRAGQTKRRKELKLLIPRPSGKRPYNAVVKVCGRDSADGGNQDNGLTLICIKDPLHNNRSAAPLLRETWGLSPAEAELALALIDTGSLQAAAARRGITEGSARQYIKRIFHKTLTKGQVDLVALIMGTVGM